MGRPRHLLIPLLAAGAVLSPGLLGQDEDQEVYEALQERDTDVWRETPWGVAADQAPVPQSRQGTPGPTVSLSTLRVPKKALKAYQKALADMEKRRLENAETRLTESLRICPDFGLAWAALAAVEFLTNRPGEAEVAARKAIELEPKHAVSYALLCEITRLQQRWQELATLSAGALGALGQPHPFFFLNNAIANYALGRFSEAGQAAREAVRLDADGSFPRARLVLGMVLYVHDDLDGAAQYLRAYLEATPGAEDAPHVRTQLAQIEQLRAAAAVKR